MYMMRDNISGLTILAVVAALCSAAKTQEDHANIEQWLTSVRQYRFGDSRQDLIRAERWVMTHAADDAERRWAAQRLGEMVTDSEATTEGRRFACRMLWVVGDERQVAALGSALDDPAMTDIARYALKGINAPQVDEQLRQALTSTTGDIRVGVITTIGHRRDDASTPLLIDLLDDDASTAAAAGRALGRIGTAAAADALRTARMKASGRLRNVLTHSLLDAAEHLIAAGQREQAASIYQALLEPAEPTRVKLAAMQGRVNLLTDEQTAAWLSSLARSHDPKMRVAAIQHLAQLKTPGVVSHLTAALTSDDVIIQRRLPF
jgi:HEAT repeat protein